MCIRDSAGRLGKFETQRPSDLAETGQHQINPGHILKWGVIFRSPTLPNGKAPRATDVWQGTCGHHGVKQAMLPHPVMPCNGGGTNKNNPIKTKSQDRRLIS